VGLFSFLSGKKGEPDAAGAAGSAGTGAAPSAPGAAATAAPEPAPPASPWSDATGYHEPPFTPPEAWNVDALTAPHPVVSSDSPQVGPLDPAQTAALQARIIEVIKTVFDPEIPVDIYELGLIYEIIVDAERRVLVRMTLTSPACPSAQQLPSEVRYKVKAIPEVTNAWVEIVWEPPWGKERMSEAARLSLGFF
jgi:FeS assembly SUF system protein